MRGEKHFFTLGARLMFFLSVVIIVTIVFLSVQFYTVLRDTLSDVASQNVLNLMSRTLEKIDQTYEQIEQSTMEMLTDEELYKKFNDMALRGTSAYMKHGPDIQEDIQAMFAGQQYVWSAEILYKGYSMLHLKTRTVQYGSLRNTEAWQLLQENRGKSIWLPKQELPEEFMSSPLPVICHARSLNIISNSSYRALFDQETEAPVILVCINGSYPQKELLKDIVLENVEYVLLDAEGDYLDGAQEAGQALSGYEEIREMGERGIYEVRIEGKLMLALCVRSQVTEWLHVIVLDPDEQVESIWRGMIKSVVIALVAVLLVMLTIALLFSHSVSSPVRLLVRKMRDIELGKFGTQISYERNDDFSYMIRQFNSMSERLHHLIDENYHALLREKDAEISRLNIQFNPHWLYNTLNAIHWLISMGEARRADRMVLELSSMLRYTSDSKGESVSLSEDIEWLKRYILLMGMRYGSDIETIWEIPEKLMNIRVLKLFLQPFIENSIIHGFRDRDFNGRIIIRAEENEAEWIFTVEDNGTGISEQKLMEQVNTKKVSGIMNVKRRLELKYGREDCVVVRSAPGEGTVAIIRIPKRIEKI